MPRGTYLSEKEQGAIMAYREEEMGIREIARKLGRSHKVVLNFLRDPTNYGKNKKGGPKKKLSPRTERRIVKAASNTLKSCKEIVKESELGVSRWTVQRVLKRNLNITRQKMKSAPTLLKRHKIARLEYARENMIQNWNNIIFSDEKKFNLDGPDGFNSYWRDLRKEQKYFSKRNFGGGTLIVWGAFCSSGKLQLAFPTSRMNSAEYIDILENNLLPFIHANSQVSWIYQQDNAPIHKSRETTAWFKTFNINLLKWPACSPDQNPIENLWGIMVRHIYANNRQFSNILELKTAGIEAWNQISEEILKNLIKVCPIAPLN